MKRALKRTSKSNHKPLIGVTLGDPKGIGPEVVREALSSRKVKSVCETLLFGDTTYYDWKRARRLTPAQCGRLSGYYVEEAARSVLRGNIDAIATAPISKAHLNLGGYRYPG